MMIVTIEGAFNTIWRVTKRRGGVSSFLLYWAILSLGPLLIGFGFLVSSYLISLPLLNDPSFDLGIKQYFLGGLPTILSVFAFTLLYVAVPNHRIPLGHGLIGGIVVAVLFELAKYSFTLFVKAFPSYQLIYGAFAVVPLFLFWIYVSWVIILMGAQLVRSLSTYEAPERSARQHHPVIILLQVLDLLWQQHNSAQGVLYREREILKALNLKDAEKWQQVRDYLFKAQVIHRTEYQSIALSRSLDHLTLWELLSHSPWGYQLCEETLVGLTNQPLSGWMKAVEKLLLKVEHQAQTVLNIRLSYLFNLNLSQQRVPLGLPENQDEDTVHEGHFEERANNTESEDDRHNDT